MKHYFYYLNITTILFTFVGCTPTPTPSVVTTKVFENTSIKANSTIHASTPSLGREISNTPAPIAVPNSTVRIATESAKTPTEIITPVYQEVVPEDSTQIEEIVPREEEVVTNTEEITIDQLPTEETHHSSKTPVEETMTDPYGNPPKDYRTTIRTYLSKKANPNDTLKYVFSRPQKAEKKDKSWRGWMVKVDMLKRNGKGEILKNQPYTILFNGSSILEDIANDNPKNITKVIY